MVTKRRKAEKLPAASSLPQAIDLLTRYAALGGQIAARKARVEAAIAQLRAEADALDAPAIADQKDIFLALKPWWAVASASVTGGERKSWELGGCLIGHRTSTPSLGYPKPEAHAIALLEGGKFNACLRVKTELDKPALIKFLGATFAGVPDLETMENRIDQQILRDWGFCVVQKEEFFIDSLPPKGDTVELVVDPQAQQVAA